MQISKELYSDMKNIVNSHIEKWLKTKLKNNLLDGFDVSFVTNGYDRKFQVHSAIGRSLDSSLGSLYEKLLECISLHFNELTLKKLKTINYTTKAKKKTFYKTDLLFKRNGKVFIIEIKLHCELDNKKAGSEKKSLETLKKVYSEEAKLSPNDIKTFIGVIGNKDGNKPTDFKMGRLIEAFKRNEVLVEKELFDFVSGVDGFFKEFIKFNSDIIIPKINNSIKLIEKQYK